MIPLWLQAVTTLTAEVIIVVCFLHYMGKRDRMQAAAAKAWALEAQAISNRCHDNQAEATKVLRELTTAVLRSNGKNP